MVHNLNRNLRFLIMANERLSWQKKRRVVSRAFVGEREVLWLSICAKIIFELPKK